MATTTCKDISIPKFWDMLESAFAIPNDYFYTVSFIRGLWSNGVLKNPQIIFAITYKFWFGEVSGYNDIQVPYKNSIMNIGYLRPNKS